MTRKNQRRARFFGRRKKRDKHREISISNAALDHYRVVYPKKNALDLMVELYDKMIKTIIKCETRFLHKECFADTTSLETKIKLPKIAKPFEISVWTERDNESEKMKTIIFINVKSSSIMINVKQIEDELTERFLRGTK